MSGNDDFFGMKIETSISFMIGRITKEDAWSGSGLEFASVVEMGVTNTSENTKVSIGGVFLEEFVKWSVMFESGRG